MPMIETTTIPVAPAFAPARWRFRAEAVKNSVAASWSGVGHVAVSMMVSAPASAPSRPSPLTTSIPFERAIGTTPCPRCSRISTRGDPTRPVAPVTAILWILFSVCIVRPFPAIAVLSAVHPDDERDPSKSTGRRGALRPCLLQLAPDGVVDLDEGRLSRIYPDLFEDRHHPLAAWGSARLYPAIGRRQDPRSRVDRVVIGPSPGPGS